jgi:hypothetical protein
LNLNILHAGQAGVPCQCTGSPVHRTVLNFMYVNTDGKYQQIYLTTIKYIIVDLTSQVLLTMSKQLRSSTTQGKSYCTQPFTGNRMAHKVLSAKAMNTRQSECSTNQHDNRKSLLQNSTNVSRMNQTSSRGTSANRNHRLGISTGKDQENQEWNSKTEKNFSNAHYHKDNHEEDNGCDEDYDGEELDNEDDEVVLDHMPVPEHPEDLEYNEAAAERISGISSSSAGSTKSASTLLATTKYDEYCESVGTKDTEMVLHDNIKRTTRKMGWKYYKMVDETDYVYTSEFATYMLKVLGIRENQILTDKHKEYLWSKYRKSVCEGMQAARSSATQALKKQFLGKLSS